MKRTICGLDECGRGALAGPLVAASVILSCSKAKLEKIAGVALKDSKVLKPHQHEKIYKALVATGATISIEKISTLQINNQGIGWANKEIFRKLIRLVDAEEYIIDGPIKIGRIKGKSEKIKNVIDADAKIPAAIAAGIVAKVERDKIMNVLHKEFPFYGWKTNTGHGTKGHIEALLKYGPTKYHRDVFVTTAIRKQA